MIWWALLAIALIVTGVPVYWTWKYMAYVRSRRQYFLALSDEAKAEIRARRKR